jgi:hypothetical protein
LHFLNLNSRIFDFCVGMLKVNTSIHTIHVDPRHYLYWRSGTPHLETNRFRPRARAIQKTRPITYRAKVLGRALLSARTDVNKFWMLLSGNAEVAFPSGTTTIATADLSDTPTTDAATSTANVAAVAASVMSTVTTTATGSLPTAVAAAATSAATPATAFASTGAAATTANVATAAASQKRKTRR